MLVMPQRCALQVKPFAGNFLQPSTQTSISWAHSECASKVCDQEYLTENTFQRRTNIVDIYFNWSSKGFQETLHFLKNL